MKKVLTLVFALAYFNLFSQNVTLKQVLVLNEGKFDFATGTVLVPPSLGTYNPISKHYSTIENIVGARFASDIVIDGNFIYTACDDKIVKFNKKTFAKIGTLPVLGVRKLAVWNDQLLVTRGDFGVTLSAYFQVFDKNSFDFLYEIKPSDGLEFSTEGVVVFNDSAFVAVNNAFEFPNYKGLIGVIDLKNKNFVREINLGADGINPDYMTLAGTTIFTLNNKDYSEASVTKYDIMTGISVTKNLQAGGGCGTSFLANDAAMYYQVFGENSLKKFDIDQQTTTATLPIGKPIYGTAFETKNQKIYAGVTDFTTFGKVFIYDLAGNAIDSFNTGIAPGNIVFDYEILSSNNEVLDNSSVNRC